jgi:hypothetical protein
VLLLLCCDVLVLRLLCCAVCCAVHCCGRCRLTSVRALSQDAVQGDVQQSEEVKGRMEAIAHQRRLSAFGSDDVKTRTPASAVLPQEATVAVPAPLADVEMAELSSRQKKSALVADRVMVETVDAVKALVKRPLPHWTTLLYVLLLLLLLLSCADCSAFRLACSLLELKRHVLVEISDLKPFAIDFFLQACAHTRNRQRLYLTAVFLAVHSRHRHGSGGAGRAVQPRHAGRAGDGMPRRHQAPLPHRHPAVPGKLAVGTRACACQSWPVYSFECSVRAQSITIFGFFMTMVTGAFFATYGVQSFGKNWPVIMRERESGMPFWVAFLARNFYDLFHVRCARCCCWNALVPLCDRSTHADCRARAVATRSSSLASSSRWARRTAALVSSEHCAVLLYFSLPLSRFAGCER